MGKALVLLERGSHNGLIGLILLCCGGLLKARVKRGLESIRELLLRSLAGRSFPQVNSWLQLL